MMGLAFPRHMACRQLVAAWSQSRQMVQLQHLTGFYLVVNAAYLLRAE